MEENNIIVKSISLTELFNYKIAIPEYQRPYLWKQENINTLLKQISEHNNREISNEQRPMFYLGSIVLHNKAEYYNVIDGQQRITTMALINYIKNKNGFEIKFENLISIKTIQENSNYLQKNVAILKDIDFDEINVTVIVTKNQDDAYNFFETLNTGGKRLSGIDIIKAHHLRKVSNGEIDSFAILWEKEQKQILEVVKLLLKARNWNNIDYKEIPTKWASANEWKKIITEDFSIKTIKDNTNIAYSYFKIIDNQLIRLGNNYSIRQPLADGNNFICYLLSFIELYKNLFDLEQTRLSKRYKEFTDKIINNIDGTIDLRALYQVALMCYASRFYLQEIESAAYLIFRFIYSKRVSVNKTVLEKAVINHNNEYKLIDRILNTTTEKEVLDWLKSYEYKTDNENLGGVKGRFVNRVKNHFEFTLPENDIANYDKELMTNFNTKNN